MLDDNVAQTLAIIIPILGAIFGLGYFLMKQISAAERRLNERIDRLDSRIDRVDDRIDRVDDRIDRLEKAVRTDFVEVRRELSGVREDLAEIRGKVDLMAAIVTKSENERMAEAIIALESRRASAQSE